MAVSYANQIENHRGLYFECTGDGATTALTVNHGRSVFANETASATVVTAPSGTFERHSGKGGFTFPQSGTPVAVSSVSVTKSSVTVNTGAAVGNGTKAYVVVVFDQSSSVN
jgi:hypothetical protein